MEEDGAPPSFWLQTSGNRRWARRGLSASLLLLLFLATFAVFFVVPPFLSLASRTFRPRSVKKGWDTTVLVLVLFVTICGFVSRSNHGGDEGSSGSYPRSDSRKSSSCDSYDRRSSDRGGYGFSSSSSGGMINSSSYPDLRAPDSPGPPPPETPPPPPRARAAGNKREPKRAYETVAPMTKDEVDKPPAAPPETPPPPPRARAAGNKRKLKRTHETVAPTTEDEVDKPPATSPAPPPPPPPSPPVFHPMEEKSGKKRRGSATMELLGMLMMKTKKRRQKSIENFESLLASHPLPSSSRLPPPTTPPLPPPPSVFRALFSSKKGKTRKALPAPPPPPPVPPSPAAYGKTRERPAAFPQSTADLITIKRSHTPETKRLNSESSDDSTNSGGLSPSIPIPLPPPPPPFNVAPSKFDVTGDYVRIESTNSWRHGAPDTEDNEGDDEASVSGTTDSPSDASSEATSRAFCPSPDVDTKAGRFIARFRDGLTLEKMSSIKQRRSNLAPKRTG